MSKLRFGLSGDSFCEEGVHFSRREGVLPKRGYTFREERVFSRRGGTLFERRGGFREEGVHFSREK